MAAFWECPLGKPCPVAVRSAAGVLTNWSIWNGRWVLNSSLRMRLVSSDAAIAIASRRPNTGSTSQ